MNEIKTINIKEEEYPARLRIINEPPYVLFVRGEILPDENYFAIVGTRIASSYGKQVALEIAGDLAEAGLTIVSGLAPGIDTYAHMAALERNRLARRSLGGGGRTVAVLGTGIDEKSIYPQSNLSLAKRIVESGALISEYPPGTPGLKQNFPQRNRIISGVSLGVLVVEAKEKSGSLITAEWALKQGRKVFAVPGSIYSSNSRGTNYLIKKGAKLVENANDVLKELNLPINRQLYQQKVTADNAEEKLILEALKEGGLYVDKIIEKTKLDPAIVNSVLATMEIKGKIRNLGRNIYGISNR